jgi:ribonuclease-3
MLNDLEQKLGYAFKNKDIAHLALTHRSVKNKHNQGSFERLEFLGDRVLGMAIAEKLYKNFEHEEEGTLAKRLSSLVSRESCSIVATTMNLAPFIRASSKDMAASAHILANAIEALLGAIFLDGGWEEAQKTVLMLWAPLFKTQTTLPIDYKTALQEWSQNAHGVAPTYTILNMEGPDHAPLFHMEVRIHEHLYADAVGPTKRSAETKAASILYEKVQKK